MTFAAKSRSKTACSVCALSIGADGAEDSAAANGLTEVALALAMAFFSIMVLGMVSMSLPHATEEVAQAGEPADEIAVAAGRAGRSDEAASDRQLIVFHDGRFLDADLAPIDPEAVDSTAILAISPDLPLAEVVAARVSFTTQDILVSTLDERWLARLEEIDQ